MIVKYWGTARPHCLQYRELLYLQQLGLSVRPSVYHTLVPYRDELR